MQAVNKQICRNNDWAEGYYVTIEYSIESTGQLKCDGIRAETRFRLSAKWTSPFKSVGASVQSTIGSRSVRISGSNAGYTMFRGSVKGTGYPLHSPVSSSLPLPCVTVCHHISTGLYLVQGRRYNGRLEVEVFLKTEPPVRKKYLN